MDVVEAEFYSQCNLPMRIMSMKLTKQIKEAAATGYILLWLLGIPLPILFVIFLLRGCS